MNAQRKFQTNSLLKVNVKIVIALTALLSLVACDSSGRRGGTSDYISFIDSMGQAFEGVRKAPKGPYKHKSENTTQRYVAASEEKVTVFNGAGEKIAEKPRTTAAFGALYLIHEESGGDFLYIFGPNGKEICPVDEGFCQIDTPGSTNTTDAKYLRDADGNKKSDSIASVKAGTIRIIEPEGVGFSDTEVFIGTSLPDASEALVSFDSISPTTGIGASEDGIVYFIDTDADSADRINDASVGTDIRDVVCEAMGSGVFACAIQSFFDKKLSLCLGSDETDFECGDTVDVGDGVSIGIGKTAEGNVAVVSTGFSDGEVYLTEFKTDLTVAYSASVLLSDVAGELFDKTIDMPPQLGHAEMDAENNAFMVSGYDTGDLAYILFDDFTAVFKAIDESDVEPPFPSWFKF